MKNKDADEKIFKVPGGLLVPLLALACIAWLLSSLSKMEIIATIIFIAFVSVIFFTMKWIKKRAGVE